MKRWVLLLLAFNFWLILAPSVFAQQGGYVNGVGGFTHSALQAKAGVAHNWLYSVDSGGLFTQTQPDFTDISGISTAAQGGSGNAYGNDFLNSSNRFFAWQCPSNVSTTMKGQGVSDMGSNWSVNNNLVYSTRQGIQSETALTTSDKGYYNGDNLIQLQQRPVMVGWISPYTSSNGRLNWGWTVNIGNCLDATYTNSAVIVWDYAVGGNYLLKCGNGSTTTTTDLGVAPVEGTVNDFVLDYSDGTNLIVKIDGTVRATTSTTLPVSTTYLAPIVGIKNLTLANAARSLLGVGRVAVRLR